MNTRTIYLWVLVVTHGDEFPVFAPMTRNLALPRSRCANDHHRASSARLPPAVTVSAPSPAVPLEERLRRTYNDIESKRFRVSRSGTGEEERPSLEGQTASSAASQREALLLGETFVHIMAGVLQAFEYATAMTFLPHLAYSLSRLVLTDSKQRHTPLEQPCGHDPWPHTPPAPMPWVPRRFPHLMIRLERQAEWIRLPRLLSCNIADRFISYHIFGGKKKTASISFTMTCIHFRHLS